MERAYIAYLLIFLLVMLGSLFAGIFVVNIRGSIKEKRDRQVKLRHEAQLIANREKAFQDKYGQ